MESIKERRERGRGGEQTKSVAKALVLMRPKGTTLIGWAGITELNKK